MPNYRLPGGLAQITVNGRTYRADASGLVTATGADAAAIAGAGGLVDGGAGSAPEWSLDATGTADGLIGPDGTKATSNTAIAAAALAGMASDPDAGIGAAVASAGGALVTPAGLVVPPKLYGVGLHEGNLYFDALTPIPPGRLEWNISGTSLGTHQNERFTFSPNAKVAAHDVTISAVDPMTGTAVGSGVVSFLAASLGAGSGATTKVMVLGDSIVAADGVVTQTLLDNGAVDPFSVTLIGTQGSGSNKHEARSGWALNDYCTSDSPFYISGAINFTQYLTNNSLTTPDWVVIFLGANDVMNPAVVDDASALSGATHVFKISSLDNLITKIKLSGAKVALIPMAMPARDQDAFGASYGIATTQWRYRRNAAIWNKALITEYGGREAESIYICPAAYGLDTYNNMSFASSAVINERATLSSTRQNNGIHPLASGKQQIGDGIWAFLKCQQTDTGGHTYGPELVTNGSFATDSGWTKGTGWTISGGTAICTTGTSANLSQNIGLVNGAAYLVVLTCSAITADGFRVLVNGTATSVQYAPAPGKVVYSITAGSNSDPSLYIQAMSGFSGVIDNVSVRRVLT